MYDHVCVLTNVEEQNRKLCAVFICPKIEKFKQTPTSQNSYFLNDMDTLNQI